MGRPIKNILAKEKYGMLTILWPSASAKNRERKYECVCDCGQTTIVSLSKLINGHTKSCGCLKTHVAREKNKAKIGIFRKTAEERFLKRVYNSIKQNAKNRDIEWSVTLDEIATLVFQNCFYCGDAPKSRQSVPDRKFSANWNGVDRIDNSVGYFLDNLVPCCKTCNMAKSDMSFANFLSHVEKIFLFQKKRK